MTNDNERDRHFKTVAREMTTMEWAEGVRLLEEENHSTAAEIRRLVALVEEIKFQLGDDMSDLDATARRVAQLLMEEDSDD